MPLGLRAKAQRIDRVDDFAQVVAADNFVFDLAKNLADFVFERVRPAGFSEQVRRLSVGGVKH